MRLTRDFYAKDARVLAKELLGKVLVREIDGIKLKGKIVETEAYIGAIDKASHAYGGRRTKRTEPLYGKPGIAYVYFIYGKYFCFNIISKTEGEAEGVLIRAIEPLENINIISKLRFNKEFEELNNYQRKNLTSGPSKLCMAFNINKDNNWEDLCESSSLYVEDTFYNDFEIIESKRVGIDYAEEARDFLWRYYIKDNAFISVK
ncbi:DNA-3-methyladenine glycosylase [Clostridium sporogenes]|uniref:DNA-3-methyladenine glycosylase n=1 Tax=Clostridium sporogenes TaxID=1509 RepID=UPI0005F059F4|nr:DNA-3-methyladenine glycosylase [Clostridium sporogenes]MBW5458807.1 DNA-3-methyladenine glycosylase [Clostridium sporogenes]NFQ01438.1 DNA-3-methyladenine glycosylase [Clostridium sporogenes]NFQ43795.1 DNA-3-methyladenine glycosylase [Clostridium sporogenes]NFT04752.1 DNA-3-methyladenine glycosylase [Clostridium sporogenes]NFT33232.1 DNA-3-methyladenine glycosylase [Clostridium sporogenes]